MKVKQEPKYDVNEGCIFNRATHEVIPDDEPVMIFRAKDKNAAATIAFYVKLCRDREHQAIAKDRLHAFVNFSLQYPERMKEPDTAQ